MQVNIHKEKREATIRLIYFDKKIKGNFVKHHADALKNGYGALGQSVPNYAQLSRKECLNRIKDFIRATNSLSATSPNADDADSLRRLLTEGLRDLKPSIIPANWI